RRDQAFEVHVCFVAQSTVHCQVVLDASSPSHRCLSLARNLFAEIGFQSLRRDSTIKVKYVSGAGVPNYWVACAGCGCDFRESTRFLAVPSVADMADGGWCNHSNRH